MLLSCSLSSVHQSRSEAIDCVTKTFLLVSGGVIKTTGTVRVRLIGRSECRTDPSLAETLNAYSLVLSDSYLRFCPLDRTCAHCCHLVLDKIEFTKDCVYVQYSILQTTYCEFSICYPKEGIQYPTMQHVYHSVSSVMSTLTLQPAEANFTVWFKKDKYGDGY